MTLNIRIPVAVEIQVHIVPNLKMGESNNFNNVSHWDFEGLKPGGNFFRCQSSLKIGFYFIKWALLKQELSAL